MYWYDIMLMYTTFQKAKEESDNESNTSYADMQAEQQMQYDSMMNKYNPSNIKMPDMNSLTSGFTMPKF